MWTAILGRVERDESGWRYTITYTDGNSKFRTEYKATSLGDEVIKQTARNEIERLETVVTSIGKVSIQEGSVIDLTPAVVVKPTAEQKAQSDFFIGYGEYLGLNRAAAAGFIAADDPRIAAARNALVWSDDYIGLI